MGAARKRVTRDLQRFLATVEGRAELEEPSGNADAIEFFFPDALQHRPPPLQRRDPAGAAQKIEIDVGRSHAGYPALVAKPTLHE